MKIFRYILAAGIVALSATAFAQRPAAKGQAAAPARCDLDISVANITKGEVVPEAVGARLEAKLSQAMSKAGLTSAPYDSRFFVAGRFDDARNDITGGPSPKVIIITTLTIYIGDADEQKIFASESFELRGVGGNDTQAYTAALNKLSGSNRQLVDFLEKGKQKIVDYYDANYGQYIQKARQQMAARNFDEALYYATAIPSCCKGYAEASALALQIYSQSMNHHSSQLLAEAKKEWGADPTATGADKALALLAQIDPGASCAAEAKRLGETISQTVQKQWVFENVTKYKDALAMENRRLANETALEHARIQAAKEASIAWAKSRPKVVNRYNFIYRY